MAKRKTADLVTLDLADITLGENHRANEGEGLQELMKSMKALGLLQPVGVVLEEGRYTLVYGYRRVNAAKALGWKQIECVVHQVGSADEIPVLNLAENIQRKSVSLAEVGRAIEMLQKQGYTLAVIAERLGKSKLYVESVKRTITEVPKEYRDKIYSGEGRGSKGIPAGMLTMRQVNGIATFTKRMRVSHAERQCLYDSAVKGGADFKTEHIPAYAANIREGRTWNEGVEKRRIIPGVISIAESEVERIKAKWVYPDDKPFTSFGAVLGAILRGEISETVKGL